MLQWICRNGEGMIKLLNEQTEKLSMDLPKDRKCYNSC